MPGLLRTVEREPFDVSIYARRILKYFADTKKTMISFAEVTQGKEHWEICRYFFATLHLATCDNIAISTVKKSDGTDALLMTLQPEVF